MPKIDIKYAVGYGFTTGRYKAPGEKTLTIDVEDLNLGPGADDIAITDAVWTQILDDIRINASAMDVLDDYDGVVAAVTEALAEAAAALAAVPESEPIGGRQGAHRTVIDHEPYPHPGKHARPRKKPGPPVKPKRPRKGK